MTSPAEPVLSIRGLRTDFPTGRGRVAAVAGVDIDVMPGECLGVVGESGSGKSVTFLSALGLVKPPGQVSGSAVFRGRELLTMPEAERRHIRGKELAITFQDAQTSLNPALTVGQQIIEVLEVHDGGGKAANRQAAIDMLALVGIPDPASRLDNFPHQFSGGMRQRAMIATALICKPRLLIADEPTSALDVTVQAQVLDLIDRMRAELGMSVVLIAHDLGVVAEHCDRIAVMYAGEVVEYGRTEAVIETPRHPYTQGLIASAPWLGDLEREIEPMPGSVPNLIELPPGCHFAPRCPHRVAACDAPIPLLRLDDGRDVRCIRAGELAS